MSKRLLNMRVDFTAKIKPVRPLNKGFTLCKCYVMALGMNRNKSNITEDAVTDALPSLFNIPVVGHIYVDEDGKYHMGGHDVKLERDPDGKFKFQVLTVPYGVVPETNNVNYEEITESNGTKKTYLTADIILWTGRYPELNETIYNENLFWGQSMEIEAAEVSRNKDDNNYIDVKRFTFSGLCLLGKSDDENYHYEPCFPEAKVEPYKFALGDDFAAKFEDMKKELSLCFNNFNKGGKELEDEDKQESVQDSIQDAPAPEPEEPTPEVPPESEPENDAESQPEQQEPPTVAVFQFAATYGGKREALGNALSTLGKVDDNAFLKYFLTDFDEKYVYVEQAYADSQNPNGKWTKGRMAYTMNADETATVDESSFQTMLVKWLTVDEAAMLDKQRDEHAALVSYKAEHETADKKRKFDSVVEQFHDLHDDEDFKKFKGKIMSFSCEEDLKKELYALRGMKFGQNQELRVPVGDVKQKSSKQELHEEFMETYLKKE